MKKIIVIAAGMLLASGLFAQGDVLGKWKTIDDETHKMKSIVEIYKKSDGKLYGKIIKLKDGEDPNKLCTECPDYRKDKKLVGMDIITGLEIDDDAWEGDDAIIKPSTGTIYDCKLWEENGELQVRGYIGFIYKTQVWVRP